MSLSLNLDALVQESAPLTQSAFDQVRKKIEEARKRILFDELLPCWELPDWAHEGQRDAWLSKAVDVAVIAGYQSGKSLLTAYWILRELQRCAPFIAWLGFGTMIYAGPTMTLLAKQALPAFKRLFVEEHQLGSLTAGNKPIFTFSKAGAKRIIGVEAEIVVTFAYTNDSSNLEAMTACGGAWDEAGQKENKLESYEAFNRRLEVARSTTFAKMLEWITLGAPEERAKPGFDQLIKARTATFQWWIDKYYADEGPEATFGRRYWGTTPYEWNWFKTEIYDKAKKGQSGFQLFNFPTWMNPRNSKERCMKAKETMPEWKWLMMFMGQYTKPAGAIYDCFNNNPTLFHRHRSEFLSDSNTCKRFEIPKDWPVFVGTDFGNVNTAALLFAQELTDKSNPTGRYFGFGSYKMAGRTNEEHAWAIRCAACGLMSDFKEAFSKWSVDQQRPYRMAGSAPPLVIAQVLGRCYLKPYAWGGSHQEQGWRDAYMLGGLHIAEPIVNNVEVGISCCYEGIKERRLIFFDDLNEAIEQIEQYSWEIDENMEAIPGQIKDKARMHYCDSLRSVGSRLFPPRNMTVSATSRIAQNKNYGQYSGVRIYNRLRREEEDD